MASPALDRHLRRMMTGFGSSTVTVEGVTGHGLLQDEEVADVDRNGEPVLRRQRVLLLAVAEFAEVRSQQPITVDDVAYSVTFAYRQDDGRYWRVVLR